jgi:hypothetical protein
VVSLRKEKKDVNAFEVAARVTRCVYESINQNLAQPVFMYLKYNT